MKTVRCPACGGGQDETQRKTKTGAQLWRCTSCGASTTQRYSNKASMLALFLDWLLSKRTQAQMRMPARTFRSLTSEFWSLWPTAPLCDEGSPVHLPRRGPERRRRRPRNQQPHRRRREPPDQVDAQRAQGHEAGPHGQGGVQALKQQAGGADVPRAGACGVPDRRDHSRAAPGCSRGQRERRGCRTMGRGC